MGFLGAAILACGLATYSFSSDAFAVSDADGAKLLSRADDIRNPSQSYTMRLQVKTDESEQELEVMLKGKDKTMIVTKAPTRDLGRNMLMLDRDFYAYIPNLKRSMRLSLAQKMSGQVSNGDIARTRWAGDYNVKVEKSDAKETQLLLDGNKPNLTYQKIRLWVETGSAKPLRADYLSLDGKTLLKKASFEDYKQLAGALRPGRLRIKDTGGKESTITITNMTARDLGDSIFSTTNLEKAR
jgi:outer membrane lipoprotein-sorting protein